MRTRWVTVLSAAVVVALAGVSTVAVAAARGGFYRHRGFGYTAGGARASCTVAALPGTVVHLTLANMGGPMMGGSMMGYPYPGTMRLVVDRETVSHGQVSFVATNVGSITHELVVLPLSIGQAIGSRTIGTDGKVDESGSLGEASRSCGDAAGEGITAGQSGWVTLDLASGRYELVCNLPGHYGAGMYAELTVR